VECWFIGLTEIGVNAEFASRARPSYFQEQIW